MRHNDGVSMVQQLMRQGKDAALQWIVHIVHSAHTNRGLTINISSPYVPQRVEFCLFQ